MRSGAVSRTLWKISAVAFVALSALAEESVRQLYERARLLQERNRNLDEAIRIYSRVVERAKDDRALAARAQLEQGILYLRLGRDEEARQAFRKVITEFPDQAPLVREAQGRLGVTGSLKPTINVRQVWATPDSDNSGGPSPDGRYLSFADWTTGDVSVRDLATGEKRHVTKGEPGQAPSSVFSADSKRIAYWRTDWSSLNEIRIAGMQGAPSRLLRTVTNADLVSLTDWSRDGKYILAYIEHRRSPAEIALISASDGSISVLKQADGWPGRMSFSPDGKFILYDGQGSSGPDVHLLSIDGSRDTALAPHPADDFAAGWSPDGRRILFASNRTGSLSLWTLVVKDGVAQGEPQLLLADAGNIEPLGITRNGSFYYWLKTGLVDVYTAAIDPESASVLEAPKPLAHRFVASNQFPDWSPDGKNLLYQSNRPGSDSLIVIRSLDTGAERDLRTEAPLGLEPPIWSAAGDAILVSGTLAGKPGIYRINPQSGAVQLSVELPAGKRTFTPAWSRDGKTLFGRFDGYHGIHSMDIATRAIRTLFQTRRDAERYEETGPSDPMLSPDGSSLLFQVRDRPRSDNLLIIRPEGGPPRTLISVKLPEKFFPAGAYAWTPDSRRIVFVHRTGKQSEISVIPAEGGQPLRTGIQMNGIRFLRLHPDGKRLAFQSGVTDGEVWVVQNLF
jgi:Tol biopolymer transport system component